MVNSIITGISQALDAEFNASDTTYTIYTENIEQGFDTPCFSISFLNGSNTQIVGNRYNSNKTFTIEYHPKNEPVDGIIRNRKECYDVAATLEVMLKSIIVDSKNVRGTNITYEVVEDILHFFVDYNLITKENITHEDSMASLKANVGVN